MKDIDKTIRKLVKQEKLEDNPDYSRQLIHMTEDLVKQPQNTQKRVHRKSFYRKYVPAAIVAIIIVAYPVKAAVDHVAEHLAEISEEEKDELRTMVYENDKQNSSIETEAIRYSRDFTESEQELYDTLLTQYDKGNFPERTLPVSDQIHEGDGDTICYNPKDKCMYLPDRELSNEELLEMIDFYVKTDYSLSTSDVTIEYKMDMKNKGSQLSDHALSENEAEAAAAFYVEKMYGITTENMEKSLSSSYGDLKITFMTDGASYSVCIQDDDGSFKDISMDKEGFVYYQDNLKENKTHIQKKGKEAKTIAVKLLREGITITDSYAQYKLDTKGQIPHGSVVYLFDLEDGNRLRMSYSIAEDTLWGAAIEYGGAGQKDLNVKNNEKRVFLHID